MLAPPIDLTKWLDANARLLRPPVSNFCVYDDGMTVMIVGGPNARTDYHINPTPEWFYQYRGAMLLKIVDDGVFRDIVIRERCMFLLPANVPHNPVRFADTVGIVLELPRPSHAIDRLRWYCSHCPTSCGDPHQPAVIVHESTFECNNLGHQVKQAVQDFGDDVGKRTCPRCGNVADAAPAPGSIVNSNLNTEAS